MATLTLENQQFGFAPEEQLARRQLEVEAFRVDADLAGLVRLAEAEATAGLSGTQEALDLSVGQVEVGETDDEVDIDAEFADLVEKLKEKAELDPTANMRKWTWKSDWQGNKFSKA
jgi:hypothetical protein